MSGQTLAEVLAGHPYATVDGCECGWRYPRGSLGRLHAEFNAHIADAVTAWIEERLTAAREGVVETLLGGLDATDASDDVRGFFRKTAEIEADAALDVVSAALGIEVRG